MAKLHNYKNYRQYVKIQTKKNKKKLHTQWATSGVMDVVAGYVQEHMPDATLGLCHGVKHGWESEQLAERLGFEVIGTDISSTAKKFDNVLQWDFHDIKDEWRNNVDFIYSNSLDHSYDPPMCFGRWMECIKPTGACFIEWSPMHGEDFVSESDPFGASEQEYRDMLGKDFEIVETFELEPPEDNDYKVERKIFVVKHRG